MKNSYCHAMGVGLTITRTVSSWTISREDIGSARVALRSEPPKGSTLGRILVGRTGLPIDVHGLSSDERGLGSRLPTLAGHAYGSRCGIG